ncbi:MAG TPA: N-acetylneuraminate synthase family protein [Methylomirabilota bacterium]|nr:N-acetylneuraminate synthase family protein [Methylomirabilota bacterium]
MSTLRMKIGDRWIGDGEPCFVVAEAGANHNRDLAMGKELIDVAAEAGADAVKFQTYSAETLYSRKTPRFSYLEQQSSKDTWQLIKEIELPREWQADLQAWARKRGIAFFSTPFDYRAVDELEALRVPAYKVASFEIVDLPLIRYAAAKGRPMIISTGLATYEDVHDAIEACHLTGNHDVVLLQCASLYPAPPARINLRSMETLRRAFGVPVGLSDHSLGIHLAGAAVALGACAIEKHFTLSRALPGPDHPFAIEPGELKEMVQQIREVEAALGDGMKLGPAPEEQEMHQKARRSLVAARNIPKGTRIERDMIAIKRPGFGIKPKLVDLVIGRVAKADIEEDTVLTWDLV